MNVKELIEKLETFSPRAIVWNENEGMPTPVLDVGFFENNDDGRHVMLK
jgi:hypothetical protein